MSNIIEELSELASELDKAKLASPANVVDSVSGSVLQIKTAQYLGIQGYWMRNTRCWQNCYRQKRARNKDMAAQEVWSSCHEEYLKSINNDKSGWEKYAGDNSMLKMASTQKGKNLISTAKKYFAKKVEAKVKGGEPIGYAVFDSIAEIKSEDSHRLLTLANKMADLADLLNSKGHKELAIKATQSAEALVKESQFGANKGLGKLNPKNWGRGVRDWVGRQTGMSSQNSVVQRLQRAMKAIENARTRLPQDMTQVPQQQQIQVQQQFQQLQQDVGAELQALAQMTRNNPQTGAIYQGVMTSFQQFSNTPMNDVASRRRMLDGLANAIQQASGVAANQNIQTQPGQQQGLPGVRPQPAAAPPQQAAPQQAAPQQAEPQDAGMLGLEDAGQPVDMGASKALQKAFAETPDTAVSAAWSDQSMQQRLTQWLQEQGWTVTPQVSASGKRRVILSESLEQFAGLIQSDPDGFFNALTAALTADQVAKALQGISVQVQKSSPDDTGIPGEPGTDPNWALPADYQFNSGVVGQDSALEGEMLSEEAVTPEPDEWNPKQPASMVGFIENALKSGKKWNLPRAQSNDVRDWLASNSPDTLEYLPEERSNGGRIAHTYLRDVVLPAMKPQGMTGPQGSGQAAAFSKQEIKVAKSFISRMKKVF